MKDELVASVKANGIKNVEFLGYKTGDELKNIVKNALFTVIPSEWYENYPLAVIESFALGKPVIGASIGGIPELVRDNETGLTFESGNEADLRAKLAQLLPHLKEIERMGRNARKFVEDELTAEKHYHGLMDIYQQARAR